MLVIWRSEMRRHSKRAAMARRRDHLARRRRGIEPSVVGYQVPPLALGPLDESGDTRGGAAEPVHLGDDQSSGSPGGERGPIERWGGRAR
jgi:hypothetical protein